MELNEDKDVNKSKINKKDELILNIKEWIKTERE